MSGRRPQLNLLVEHSMSGHTYKLDLNIVAGSIYYRHLQSQIANTPYRGVSLDTGSADVGHVGAV